MAVRILPAWDRQPTAWKNGGGITREVAAHPPGAALADFAWRVSFADVADGGPFSTFPDVDRIITLVAGQGMELLVDGRAVSVADPYVPYAFSGDADVDCRLIDGPIVDFNVMARRGVINAAVEIVDMRREFEIAADTTVLVVALTDGSVSVALEQQESEVTDSGKATLDRYDAALLTGCARVMIEPDGVAAVVTFSDSAP